MALKICGLVRVVTRPHSLDCQENPVQRCKGRRIRSKLRDRRLWGMQDLEEEKSVYSIFF